MKKTFLRLKFLAVSSLLCCYSYAAGIVDITAKLTNPSFEADDITSLTKKTESDGFRGYIQNQPNGWTYSGSSIDKQLIITTDCYTDNNFGKVTTLTDGTQGYYLRMGWSTGSSALKQNVTLGAGKYRLTADIRSAYANSATSSIKIVAGSNNSNSPFTKGGASCFPGMQWSTVGVDFTITEETTISLGFNITWASGGSCVMIDNVRLYDVTNETVEPDPTEGDVASPTEGVIDNTFVPESEMMTDLLKMLARFTPYMKSYWFQCASPNSISESCGFFYNTENGNSPSCPSGEKGVRPNADLSMVAAFLVKYAKPAGITLPTGITYDLLEEYAMKSLIYAYSTHKANKLKICSGGDYWGSTSTSDAVWESSLWAMSVAYSAFFQWDKLSDAQKGYVYALLKAECNYELNRTVPTGYAGDTKAEENGWEADVLAATLGLFPDDALAEKWFERMRLFAVNSYSHYSDASDSDAIDPDYNDTSVADLYKGNNLYSDYTLQNHNLFHTSYQNVVMQELGEAALALKLFQTANDGSSKVWASNALQHNNQEVMDNVLNWLALADGELAMPNGNDWSLFLYDQITSYSTQACFQRDPNALLLENLAYKQIKARQATTPDGSWLLRPDVAARRMGVEAHRVMMTYLMHLTNSTADITPTSWEDFRNAHSKARTLDCQNVVRAYTPERFSCFSWSDGLKSYTGYFAADKADKNKIIVPYRANNSGNLTGWYEVSGKGTNASPVVNGIYQLDGNAWVMNGELAVNDKVLDNRFAIYSTQGNAIIYLDYVKANSACTITAEKGGLLAISTDELTKQKRTLYYDNGEGETAWKQTDGISQSTFSSDWVNIDNEIGVAGHNGKKIAFGDRDANNSIYTSKLYPMYNDESRAVKAGDYVDARHLVYYSNVTAETTRELADDIVKLTFAEPTGWNGVIARDPSKDYYIMVANFFGSSDANTVAINALNDFGVPVIAPAMTIEGSKGGTATYSLSQNNSYAKPVRFFIAGDAGAAEVRQISDNEIVITASATGDITVSSISSLGRFSEKANMLSGSSIKATLTGDGIEIESVIEPTPYIPQPGDDMTGYIKNPHFAGNSTEGWKITSTIGSGARNTNYNAQEFWQCNSFDIQQVVTGLPQGQYRLSCQAFYRDGSSAQAATSYQNGTFAANAKMYANDATVPLPSICSEAGTMGNLGITTSLGYVPNNMEQAQQYFLTKHYEVGTEVTVDDTGIMTIGIRKDKVITNDWAIFTNFRLTYLGGPTGINKVKGERLKVKGQGDTIYRLDGTKVSTMSQPGIYIYNGKKVTR